MKRHPHDDTVQLDHPAGYSDPNSPTFVPIPLRAAFDELDDATVDRLKRKLYTEIREPWLRDIDGRTVALNHRTNPADFDTALVWLKLDTAARRITRDNQLRTSQEQNQRTHTCKLCGRYDPTARTATGVVADRWCELVPRRTAPPRGRSPRRPRGERQDRQRAHRGHPHRGDDMNEIVEYTTFDRRRRPPPGRRSHGLATTGRREHRSPSWRLRGLVMPYRIVDTGEGLELFHRGTEWESVDGRHVFVRLEHSGPVGIGEIYETADGLYLDATVVPERRQAIGNRQDLSAKFRSVENHRRPDGVLIHDRVVLHEISLVRYARLSPLTRATLTLDTA